MWGLIFTICERIGFHIVRNHFYQPVPDTGRINPRLWSAHSQLIGIELNEKRQPELLNSFTTDFKHEYERFPENRTQVPYEYYMSNGFFGPVDGEILYYMIRYFRPKEIFEIGSEHSTFLSAQAVLRNGRDGRGECRLVAFEPYPNATLLKGFPGLHELHTIKAQEIPIELFEQLEEKDILFIDSSLYLRQGVPSSTNISRFCQGWRKVLSSTCTTSLSRRNIRRNGFLMILNSGMSSIYFRHFSLSIVGLKFFGQGIICI